MPDKKTKAYVKITTLHNENRDEKSKIQY